MNDLPSDTQPKAQHPRRLEPRQAFVLLAVVLVVVLVVLVVSLIKLLLGPLWPFSGGDEDGLRPLFTISGPGTGYRPKFTRPLGVAIGKDRRIYVSDSGNNRVCVFDMRGRFLFQFGGLGVAKPASGTSNWRPGLFNFPAGIDVDEQGRVYVADFRNDQIQVFTSEGRFILAFPDPREPVGRGSSGQDGRGIAVTDVFASDGRVYVTDQYQVFVFDEGGRLLRQFGKPGRGPGDLDHPGGIAAASDGTIYVSDSNHARVTAFSPLGRPIWSRGRIPADLADRDPGDFGLPRGLTVLDDGRILVTDAFDFELVQLSRDGKVVERYGGRGVERGTFNFPNDVDALGSLIAVADKENDRVQVMWLTR